MSADVSSGGEPTPIVLGTAGHIDHGKTALVRALTGIDTDRLAVEKQRGITTELGFAHLDLRGHRIAVVDVPGHERFIRSMVAGATGLDLVLLVIAADEGVMPQTREHLDVCQLLGVRRGIVVINKRDLVDDEWLMMVDAELAGFVAGTFLEDAPRIAVSARTGDGMDDLRAAITATVESLPPRPATGVFRLPIDRVFTLKGFGTVVTGTIASGAVATGDELAVLPRGIATRARGLQVHGAAVDRARAGQRCAVNLGGVSTDELARGDVLAHPGAVAPTHLLDVRIRHVAGATSPLPLRSKVLVHHGTVQVGATLVLVGARTLAPGAESFAQLRIDRETPLAAAPGDRFIVRGFQPLAGHGTTLGGGEVIRVHAAKARAADHAAMVARFAAARFAERLALEIHASHAAAPTIAELVRRTAATPAEVADALAGLVASGQVVRARGAPGTDDSAKPGRARGATGTDDSAKPGRAGDVDTAVHLHAEIAAVLEQQILARLELPREEIRQKLPGALPARAFDALTERLVARGILETHGDSLRRSTGGAPRPAPVQSPLEAELAARFAQWALEPPRPKELAAALGKPEPAVAQALTALTTAKLVTKVKPDLYVATAALAQLETRLRAYLAAHKEITPQAWKELTGASRKYSIPLAEHFDALKVTLRVGDLRRLR
ncbi:MAG TPA: selenocysteine-specific translation elongation factor [Kofleriaceae bacterium]|nr:selenocysteine-specific translation elongation factor [Kofleriaceae bacterium]